MKFVHGKIGLMFRLGAVAAASLLGQQAMAVGTPAGEVVENTASVAYDILTVPQTAVPSNTETFVVDRRVDFAITLVGGALVPITPLDTDAFFDLRLTNTSNSALDFRLILDQAGVTTVRGLADTTNMVGPPQFAVSADFVADSDPVQGGPQFIDDLPADEDVIIRVWGDAATSMLNGQIAGIEISATAAEPGAVGLGGDLDDSSNDILLVDNVFADADNDGVQAETDGFIVSAANLTVDKSFAIVDGDLNSGKLIPGARIEYTIVISNAATASTAENVIVTDAIDDDLAFLLSGNGSDYADIQVNDGVTTTECTADAPGSDTDGCSFDGTTLVVGGANRDIDILASGAYTVKFQVRIPETDPTPPPSP